ncbi:Alpha/Beta hydrolase protein [Ilyonectria robusta]|uniref:Alpha/Beta hydrolase protein n=1 Tax=Ilyonectria robusta TaxID=1079257 RepID=UPI001E8E0C16|nr:Alpha/Beta hydrolase protein [Ilyonectria robusta]KAH8729924.1 Alpha/Beta hydrolase protein [Ilyonectria robusta]
MNGFHPDEFEHPQLGRLVGIRRNEHVVQFRSIPFARAPARFRQARLIDELSPKQKSCTEYTYACPQEEQSMEVFGGPLPGEDQRRYDEFSCLNLTITAPAELLEPGCTKKVPVMVYVHGGGFVAGAHYGGPHDMTPMATLACQDSKPVIIDLIDEAAKYNEDPCNFALYDQRLAFLWTRKYISGFGGDVNQVTAFGESAGSASLCFHLSSDVPLFNRVVLQSGTASTISPTPCAKKEEEYLALLAFCGINKDDPQRLEKLREVPATKIVEATTVLMKGAFSPLAHESFFPIAPNYLNYDRIVADCPWVEAVMAGDAIYEGYLFAYNLKTVHIEDFCKHVESILGAEKAQKVLQLYDISAGMDPNLFWTQLCTFCGDVMFSLPCHKLLQTATRSRKQVYRYTLSLRNPFPGSFFSGVLGHHFIELAYQFMTLMDRFPLQKQRDISIGFARKWTAFAYGEEPWAPYMLADETIAVADSREGWVVRTRAEDMESSADDEGGQRRYAKWEALDAVFCELGDGAVAAVTALSFPTLVTLAKS